MEADLFAFSVPFRDLAPAVDEWRERTCQTKPSHGVSSHVTLLMPAPADVDGAAEALTAFSAFDVTFARFGRFPGTLWLAPEPQLPLRARAASVVLFEQVAADRWREVAGLAL
jgi:2'-5' RNA ligase superfamily